MVGLPEIRDRESLEAWLKTRPREDAVTIAHRAAMRVAPLWVAAMGHDAVLKADVTGVTILRLLLSSGVASKMPSPRVSAAALAADAAAELVNRATEPLASARLAAVAIAAQAARNAAAAAAATDAVALTMNTVVRASASTHAALSTDNAPAVLLETAEQDAHRLSANDDLERSPLWVGKNPHERAWQDSQPVLRDAPGGDFWIDWYQRALDGRPQNWPLLRDVALIDNALWAEGGDALDKAINGVRQEHALAATANAETVEPNPDTGKLRIVPASQMPDSVATYARRKILGAARIFDGEPDQAYGGLSPDLAMLRAAVEDADNLPVELLDACASATRRLVVRIETGDCPSAEQDPLIADYRHRLRDVGADILASDPETRNVLERRATITGNDALIENAEEIGEVVKAVEPLLESRLAGALPVDAQTATDPDANPEDRAAASFRLAGRILRIERALPLARDVCAGFAAGNAGLVGVAGYLQAMEFFATSPAAKAAMAAIYRYIGL